MLSKNIKRMPFFIASLPIVGLSTKLLVCLKGKKIEAWAESTDWLSGIPQVRNKYDTYLPDVSFDTPRLKFIFKTILFVFLFSKCDQEFSN